MNTLERLEASRNINPTMFINFDEHNPKEWKVHEYLHGGALCRNKWLTVDFFDAISYVNHETHPILNKEVIQAIGLQNGKPVKILTLIKK